MIHWLQTAFPFLQKKRPAAAAWICINQVRVPILYARHPRARRYRLRVDREGSVRVTLPAGGSKHEAYRFAMEQHDWIARQLAKRQHAFLEPLHARSILLRGERLSLEEFQATIFQASALIAGDFESELLKMAREELPFRVQELAHLHRLRVKRIAIRNQRSRWGSCSSNGTISLNWRLIQMPPEVCDYIILHELMHLREMNHSSRFWKLVEDACPNYRQAQAWIRQHAAVLGMR